MTSHASRRAPRRAAFACAALLAAGAAMASDHLDTPTAVADPRADIGDLYAWMSPDATRLNLAMTIVGPGFSDQVSYAFHIDSGHRFSRTGHSSRLVCRVSGQSFSCEGAGQSASGRLDDPAGATSGSGGLRAFAGTRDDPFFNNVRGTRDAYDHARAAIAGGATFDPAGCPQFGADVAREVRARWRSTDGGPASNFLKGWQVSSLVLSLDRRTIARGGPLLAIWASTSDASGPIDRAARPLTANALLATLGSREEAIALKERYNRTAPADGEEFVAELARGAALYDGMDGRCGNGFLADRRKDSPERYYPLARLLADDRLWVDSRHGRCTALFAVERAALAGASRLARDCGGRRPEYDASNLWRSLLAAGTPTGLDDGLDRDEVPTLGDLFPFLAPASGERAQ